MRGNNEYEILPAAPVIAIFMALELLIVNFESLFYDILKDGLVLIELIKGEAAEVAR